MIFVYSGTGNSYQVARFLADSLGESLVNIPSAIKYERYSYDAKNTPVGFVFPTYDSGIPESVREFASRIEVRNRGTTFCVTVCGEDSSGAAEQFIDELGDRISVDAIYDVLMPDNRAIGKDAPTAEEAKPVIESGLVETASILSSVKEGTVGNLRRHSSGTQGDHEAYDEMRSTERFFVDKDRCIQCRLCAMFCQSGTIVFYDRYPVWDEPRCDLCHACIDMCPKHAIEFGDDTVGKRRWFNPVFYDKSIGIPVRYDIK